MTVAIVQLWFNIQRWFVRLSPQKAVMFLLSLCISYLAYENYNLKEENERISTVSDSRSHRADSLILIANARVEECNSKRQADLEKSNEFWSKKVEKLEKYIYKDYETIKQVRRK